MNEVDILGIDTQIHHKFQAEFDRLNELEIRLAELDKSLRATSLRPRIKEVLSTARDDLFEKVEKIKGRDAHHFYIAESVPLLQKYKDILSVPMKISFIGKQVRNDKEKRGIISQYIEIAKKHVHI
jgi:hypothetical protein